jgi:hypothetical protein
MQGRKDMDARDGARWNRYGSSTSAVGFAGCKVDASAVHYAVIPTTDSGWQNGMVEGVDGRTVW